MMPHRKELESDKALWRVVLITLGIALAILVPLAVVLGAAIGELANR